MSTFSTYGLVCPITKNIFYVGVSSNVSKRLIQHKCKPVNRWMRQYLKLLKSKRMIDKIEVQILEPNISLSDKSIKEKIWIKRVGMYKILMNRLGNPRGYVGMLKAEQVINII